MTRAIDRFLEAAAILGHAVEVRRFPEGTKTAADAARAIGCDVAQIVKSLVFVADGRPILALTSGRIAWMPAAWRRSPGGTRPVARPPRRPGPRPASPLAGPRRSASPSRSGCSSTPTS